jgi:hypothetical protein
MEAVQRSLVISCGFKGFSLAEIVVQVIHKNVDSFHILREHSSSPKGILERENRFLSLTNSEKKADGGFYIYLIHVIHRPPIWGSDLTVVIDDKHWYVDKRVHYHRDALGNDTTVRHRR